jgi:ribosomal protein S18 acetylase RimI-like enzyme
MQRPAAEIEIRPMTIDDVSEVFHLGERLFTSQEYTNLYRAWDEFEVTGLFQTEPELCFVADAEGSVAGFAMGTIVKKQRSAWNYAHLVWLAVDDPYQRYGIAGRLFNAFCDQAKEDGARIAVVDTQADNKGAIRFFQDKGFANPTEHVYLSLNLENRSDKE